MVAYTPSNTPTRTNTPTNTATSTPTHTPTIIPSPTNTFTPTPTLPPAPIFANAVFTYDGDGKRVKSVMDMTTSINTTYFIGAYYEVTDGVATKYYYAGSQRIAMRTDGVLNFILGDHLGSTSLVTDASGVIVSQQYYKAWGEVRYASGNMPTKYSFTGQYSHTADFGLMFFNARWVDVSLGRFAQADSIVPGGVQGYDRYAYANNSPVNYVDPSGHEPKDGCYTTNSQGQCADTAGNPTGSESGSSTSSYQFGCSYCNFVNGDAGPVATSAPVAPLYVVLAGGSGVDIINTENNDPETKAKYANQPPLGIYANWALSQGYTPIPVNNPGKKVDQRERIIAEILKYPGALFILIGHSSGADSSILAKTDPRVADYIIKTVLLDPTLTAGDLGLPNNDISSFYGNIAGPDTYLAATYSGGMSSDYFNLYVSPANHFGSGGISLTNWTGLGNPDVTDHTAMAIDPVVLNSMLEWLAGR